MGTRKHATLACSRMAGDLLRAPRPRACSHMVTAGMDATVKVWDVRTFKHINSYYCPAPATALDISQRGLLAVGYGPHVQVVTRAHARAPHRTRPPLSTHRGLATLREGSLASRVVDLEGCAQDQGAGAVPKPPLTGRAPGGPAVCAIRRRPRYRPQQGLCVHARARCVFVLRALWHATLVDHSLIPPKWPCTIVPPSSVHLPAAKARASRTWTHWKRIHTRPSASGARPK